MEYKGWIPTVTGRLSFEFFGDSDCPTEAVSQNISDAVDRYAIIFQKRYLSDATLPLKHHAARCLFGQQSVFWYVCIGFCPEAPPHTQPDLPDFREPNFIGRLYIFNNDGIWNRQIKNEILAVQILLKRFSAKPPQERVNLKNAFDDHYNKLKEDLSNQSIFCANFELSRHGVLTITVDESLIKNAEAPKFPDSPILKSHLQHIVCSQLFFFLRDIGHRHQHHHPSTDTIIDLYPSLQDDITWRRETLRSLCRKAVEFKRSKRHELYSSALGVLAYIKSFQKINNIQNNGQKVLPGFNVVALEKGINASIQGFDYYSKKIKSRDDKIRNILLTFFGLILSFLGLYKLTDLKQIPVSADTQTFIHDCIKSALDHPVATISLVIAVFFLISVVTRIIDIYNLPVTRGFGRLFITFNRGVATLISFLLMTIIGSFTLWYVFLK